MRTRAQESVESFNVKGGVPAQKWLDWGTPQTKIVDGRLQITTTTAANYYGIDLQDRIDLTGSYVKIRCINAGNQGLSNYECVPIVLTLDATNTIALAIATGSIIASKQVAGSFGSFGSTSYDSNVHKYFRIREGGGTLFYEYSTDGDTWSAFASGANPFALTDLVLSIEAGNDAVDSACTCTFDDLNVITVNKPHNLSPTARVGNGMSISHSAT